LLFAGADKAIRNVMVGGNWVIRDHCHGADAELRENFARVMGILCAPAP
jgi:formimidoylglutamate deiminase